MFKCSKCMDKGWYKEAREEEKEKFEKLFDMYEDHGFSTNQAYDMAVNQVKYRIVICDCEKGREHAAKKANLRRKNK